MIEKEDEKKKKNEAEREILIPIKDPTAFRIAVFSVMGLLLQIIKIAPDYHMPAGMYWLLTPSAIVFTAIYLSQKVQPDRIGSLREVARGLWLAVILCFLVQLTMDVPYLIFSYVQNYLDNIP